VIYEIDFDKNDNWLDGPLPSSEPRPPSGWVGLERIMPALVRMFCKGNDTALEFGVEYGYSTATLAQLFGQVKGVDWFKGDEHSGERGDYYEKSAANLAKWKNVTLVKSSYQDYIKSAHPDEYYDLIHVDVVHTYEATYECGRWAADHSPVTIFHDTSFIWPSVPEAIERIAQETGKSFYNYRPCNGLGILV
jgi:hypothetical protein